jgi:hypothetical protein
MYDMSYNVEEADLDETEQPAEDEEKVLPKKAKKRKKERKSKHRKSKRSRHEELGPPPESKVDLNKLESDIMELYEGSASTGNFI